MGRYPQELLAACRNKSPRELRFSVSDLFIDEVYVSYSPASFPGGRGTVSFSDPLYVNL